MKHLRVFAVLALLTASFASAQESASKAVTFANINQGDFLTGASASLSKSFGDFDSLSFYINAPIQYFVVDRLAVGGVAGFAYYDTSSSSAFKNLAVGPAATYYFCAHQPVGTYVSQSFVYANAFGDNVSGTHYWTSNTSVGMEYFFTPSTSFGPALQYAHYFESDQVASGNSLSLFFSFGVHL